MSEATALIGTEEGALTDSTNGNGSDFPPEYVTIGIKEKPEYGLLYAKAMWSASNRFGVNGTYYGGDDLHTSLMEVAQGRQSVDKIRRMFGYFNDSKTQDPYKDDGSSALAYIDVQVLNLAPKYINRAVAKVMAQAYEVQIEAIDPVSVHEKANYEASIKAFYVYKAWITEMGMSPRDFFPDLDVDVLPEYPDELLMEMAVNPKLRKAIDGENALALIHQINQFNQVMREVIWDMVVFGPGHVHCYRDENGVPRYRRINDKYYIGSFVENESFKDQEYAGEIEFITINQFVKEAKADGMSEDEINDVIRQYASDGSRVLNLSLPDDRGNDGLRYIPVLRFYFLSEDTRQFLIRPNQKGNDSMFERGLAWKPNEKDQALLDRGVASTANMSYTSVYGGTWIIESDIVLNYGRRAVPQSILIERTLPIKTFAPNFKDGRAVSFLSQMIEPLFMINVAWNKIKEILAKGWMGVQEVDFTALEKVALGKGGKSWTPRQVYQHFLQTGRLITRTPINKHQQKIQSSAIQHNPAGIELADYFTAFTTGIQMLESMTNTDVASATQQPDRLAVRVAQMSQLTGDMDMQYLYNAYEYMYNAVSHETLLNLQEAKRDGVGIQGFVPALGKHVTVPDSLPYAAYGLYLTKAPGPEEWALFLQSLQEAKVAGEISTLDEAYIREIKNLKQARYVLGLRIKINERKAMQAKQMDNQMAMEANIAATQEKQKGDAMVEDLKHRNKMEQIQYEAMLNGQLLDRELSGKAAIQGHMDRTKKDVAIRQANSELLKQVTKNQTQKEVEAKKAEEKAKEKAKTKAKSSKD